SWRAAGRGRPAGGAREEDDTLGVARHLGEALHELGLAAAARRFGGDSRPHPGIQLAAEGLDQLALLLRHLHVAPGEDDLAITGLHAEELHRVRIMANGRPRIVSSGA